VCFLLLDNVSEPELLSESQLAVLPKEPWVHVAATTRLGISDIGAVGSRGSVAMIEVDRLNTEDGVALIREHQTPATRTGCTRTSAAPKKPPPHASSSSY
jgi:hypothetical protein